MSYKDDVYKNVREYCISHYELLDNNDFVLGSAMFNCKCHMNAVQKIKEGKAKNVYLCVAWDKDDKQPCIHFINTTFDEKYQDNTWGWIYKINRYYLIKQVSEKEYDYIWNVLMNTKRSIFKLNSNRFKNFLHKLDENII